MSALRTITIQYNNGGVTASNYQGYSAAKRHLSQELGTRGVTASNYQGYSAAQHNVFLIWEIKPSLANYGKL
jgi:hypothetical protein